MSCKLYNHFVHFVHVGDRASATREEICHSESKNEGKKRKSEKCDNTKVLCNTQIVSTCPFGYMKAIVS